MRYKTTRGPLGTVKFLIVALDSPYRCVICCKYFDLFVSRNRNVIWIQGIIFEIFSKSYWSDLRWACVEGRLPVFWWFLQIGSIRWGREQNTGYLIWSLVGERYNFQIKNTSILNGFSSFVILLCWKGIKSVGTECENTLFHHFEINCW